MFDSIVNVLAFMYIDNPRFKEKLDKFVREEVESEFLRFVAVYAKDGCNSAVYNWRMDILLNSKSGPLVEVQTHSEVTTVHCSQIKRVFKVYVSPFFPSITSHQACQCIGANVKFLQIEDEVPEPSMAQPLRELIEEKYKEEYCPINRKCKECKKNVEVTYEPEEVVFVHRSNTYLQRKQIPKLLQLQDHDYEFVSAVESIQGGKEYGVLYPSGNEIYNICWSTKLPGIVSKDFIPLILVYKRQSLPSPRSSGEFSSNEDEE